MLLEVYTLYGNTEEFWDFIMRNRLILTEEQFEFAVEGLRTVKDEPTDAARMVLVEGKEPSEVAAIFNTEPSNISNKVGRILEYMLEKLDKSDMALMSCIVDKDLVSTIKTLESKSMKSLKKNHKK